MVRFYHFILFIFIGLLIFSDPAYAAQKINSVKFHVDVTDYDEEGEPEFDVEVSSGAGYSFADIMTYEDYLDRSSSSTSASNIQNVYVVELTADDDHVFYVQKKSDIKASGLGSEYIRAARKNQGSTLEVVLRFNNLDSKTGSIEDAFWDRNRKGYGVWDNAHHAVEYQIRFRDEKRSRTTLITTGGPGYDFRPLMLEEGYYSYTVKPVSVTGYKGDFTESESYYVSPEEAAENKKQFEVQKQISYEDENAKGPGNEIITYLNLGWQFTEDGRYWFRNQDGTYPQMQWLYDNGNWYFFDQNGYVIHDIFLEWKGSDYYFASDGHMLVNDTAPDKRKADDSGMLIGKRSKKYEYCFFNSIPETESSGPGMPKKV